MTLGILEGIRNGWLDNVNSAINGGAGAGYIEFYDGTRPATAAAVTTQTLLGTVVCSDPAAPAASGGVLTFSAFTEDSNADANGDATWARILDSTGTFVADASVGATSSGEDIELNSVSITAGGIIRITSGTLTAGNA